MKEFNLNQWLEDTAQTIADELHEADPNEYVDLFLEQLHQEVDRAVIYYSDAVAIIYALGYYSGYDESDFAPFKNISQIAFAGLYEHACDHMEPKVIDDKKGVLIRRGESSETLTAKE